MSIEGIFPFVMLWVIWRILSKVQTKLKGLPPVQPRPQPPYLTRRATSAARESSSDDELAGVEDIRPETTPATPPWAKPVAPLATSPADRVCHKYSCRSLRRAVVWAEILAPPIGLREEESLYR